MILISMIVGGGLTFSGSYFRTIFGVLTALTIYMIVTTEDKFSTYINIYISIWLVSSVVALYQYTGAQWAYDIQTFLQSGTEQFNTKEYILINYRPAGLALFSVLFSYHVSAIFPITLFFALFTIFGGFSKGLLTGG